MRQAIATAPRDGSDIILEDDASGTYDVVHWSAKAGEWISENGEPSKVTPSYWHPMSADKERRGLNMPSEAGQTRAATIAITLVAAALASIYFSAEVATYVKRYAGLQDIVVALQQQAEAYRAILKEAVQVKPTVAAPAPEARKSLIGAPANGRE
jgi:hypothetical protein